MAWYDSFEAMAAADLDSSFFGASEFADSVIFFQGERSPKTITCQVCNSTSTILDHSNHQVQVEIITVTAKADSELGMLNPTIGNTVKWNDKTWEFSAVKSGDLGTIIVVFQRSKVTQSGHNRPPSL